jgi:hypothetical protein
MKTKTKRAPECDGKAVALLIAGKTDAAAGEGAGVTRQTVNEWRNHSPAFIAALNAQRQELFGAHTERLRGLVPKAIDALENAFEIGDPKERIAVAVHILKAAGLYGSLAAPTGETTPDAVACAMEIEEKRRENSAFMEKIGFMV